MATIIDRRYNYGGIVFRFLSDRPLMERAQSEAFAVEDQEPDLTYELLPLEPEMPHEWDQPIILRRQGDHIRAYLDLSLLSGISPAYFLSRVKAAELLPEKGAFILHASYIVHEGRAILFTAPSETGKSTQAHLWAQERGANIVNEDRVLLRCHHGVWQAHGCWATGTAGVTDNISAPVRAVVLLGQGKSNRVYVPGAVDTFRRLVPQCSFDNTDTMGRTNIIDLVTRLMRDVTILGYDCLPDASAVAELEKYL